MLVGGEVGADSAGYVGEAWGLGRHAYQAAAAGKMITIIKGSDLESLYACTLPLHFVA